MTEKQQCCGNSVLYSFCLSTRRTQHTAHPWTAHFRRDALGSSVLVCVK